MKVLQNERECIGKGIGIPESRSHQIRASLVSHHRTGHILEQTLPKSRILE